MIMYSNKNYLEDRNNQNQASTTIYNIPLEPGCALVEKLMTFFDVELFYKKIQNLQHLLAFHAMTRFRSLFSKKMVGSPREKTN